jgi:hypothetical protein
VSSIGEVGTSSFDAYEGIRIVIPGAVAFALGAFAVGTIAPQMAGFIRNDAIISLIASLILGLILYYWDLPARSAACLQNQPTAWLEEQYPNKGPGELLTAYFEILNTVMPSAIRNRALYMGSMYRIGLELILTLATSAAVVIAFSMARSVPGWNDIDLTSHRVWAVTALILTFIVSFLISVSYERKVSYRIGRGLDGLFARSLQGLLKKDLVFYCVGLAILVGSSFRYGVPKPLASISRWMSLVGYTICFVYWIVRYVRGDALGGSDPRKRKPIPAPTSALLLLLPIAWGLISRSESPQDPLSDGAKLAGWTAVVAFAQLSIVLRGHERKLHGSYAGQTRWLKHNRPNYERIIDPTLPAPEASQPMPAATSKDDVDVKTESRPETLVERGRRALRAWNGR